MVKLEEALWAPGLKDSIAFLKIYSAVYKNGLQYFSIKIDKVGQNQWVDLHSMDI